MGLLEEFFAWRTGSRRPAAEARLGGLTGMARLEELARMLEEEGYMPEVTATPDGRPMLRLCNCPIAGLAGLTDLPCRAELGFLESLLEESLVRTEHRASGSIACAYTPGR
jgi:predicted ArsR family transcriptional regulator